MLMRIRTCAASCGAPHFYTFEMREATDPPAVSRRNPAPTSASPHPDSDAAIFELALAAILVELRELLGRMAADVERDLGRWR
jgi:hypothetical protein